MMNVIKKNFITEPQSLWGFLLLQFFLHIEKDRNFLHLFALRPETGKGTSSSAIKHFNATTITQTIKSEEYSIRKFSLLDKSSYSIIVLYLAGGFSIASHSLQESL